MILTLTIIACIFGIAAFIMSLNNSMALMCPNDKNINDRFNRYWDWIAKKQDKASLPSWLNNTIIRGSEYESTEYLKNFAFAIPTEQRMHESIALNTEYVHNKIDSLLAHLKLEYQPQTNVDVPARVVKLSTKKETK